jgi:2-polyprenyl-6-methoxyphenol hydroxylase-like FAD-dependent oxidoreductase
MRRSVSAAPYNVVRRARCRRRMSTLHSTIPRNGDLLRVAIVGGGAAGLSSALHLAPLVEQGLIASPIDIYDSPKPLRDIGVGIWSTALDPFRKDQTRISHQLVYNEMINNGTWIQDVGYRTINGNWLMKSRLPVHSDTTDTTSNNHMPALLFLRERDMLTSLQKAVHWEEQVGTIQLHRDGKKTHVIGLQEDSSTAWSTRLKFPNDLLSDTDYHLILAADGTHSTLRRMYGGHAKGMQHILTGAAALPNPMEYNRSSSDSLRDPLFDDSQHHEAVEIEDRQYSVFRGNSPFTLEQMGDDKISFQTWGEGRSMRFATVPLVYPGKQQSAEERQVWFITINDDPISREQDPRKRRSLLLEAFKDWHAPICQLVEATPPEEILVERAIAHRHSMGPVLSFNNLVQKIRGQRPPSSGNGPALVFTGDACMTIDPILAQGFTYAMEGSYETRLAIEMACQPSADSLLSFDPELLRSQLRTRHDSRLKRLIALLRATELVQALGQPTGGTLSGLINRKVLRPVTRITPNFIKAPMFDAVLKYSLGLYSKGE